MRNITALGFDADDTLWENMQVFRTTEAYFTDLLDDYADRDHVVKTLLAAERRNIKLYGYGIKGFALSMIETALDVTNDKVGGDVIRRIIELTHEMYTQPIDPLPHVVQTLKTLQGQYRMILITKGDLFDQERKLAQSGLGEYFDAVEVVSEKTRYTYESIFAEHADGAAKAMMIGNSLKSDVIPALEAGSWGLYVPHHTTWELEEADPPESYERYKVANDIGQLPDLLKDVQA